jgi:hypothetical protein
MCDLPNFTVLKPEEPLLCERAKTKRISAKPVKPAEDLVSKVVEEVLV